ncbi:MAG: 5'-deoxyadenosine deaminase [Bacteriovoracia bacterium]
MKRSLQKRNSCIVNATILTQDSNRKIIRGNIFVQNGTIEYISSKTPRPTKTNKINIIDAKDKIIIPGFVQTHVHLCQTLFRNQADDLQLVDWLKQKIWPFEASHNPFTIRISALLGIYELLSTGTTTVLDMATVRHTEQILEAIKETGIRASVGKCLMDHTENCPPYLCESTDSALKEALNLYEQWNESSDGRIRISLAPRFALSCTENLFREVAKTKNITIHTHASENKTEVELIRREIKQDAITYFNKLGLLGPKTVLAHCIWLNENEKQLIASTKTNITHCPSSNLKLASGRCDLVGLRGLGINISLGADGAPCNNNLNMFQEMRLAALLHKPVHGPKAIYAQEAFDMATRNGAEALSWFDRIGSIEPGKKADLVALDLNKAHIQPIAPDVVSSIVYSAQPSDVCWTMVDGKLVYKKNKLAKPFSNLLADTNKAWKQILKRKGNL